MSVVDKPGYKETEAGWIPVDWEAINFGALLSGKPEYGANAAAAEFCGENSVRYIRITDIDEAGRLIETGKKYLPMDEAKDYLLTENDLLIARSGNTVGKSLLFKENMGRCAFAGYLIRFRMGERLDPKYAAQYLHSDAYWTWVKESSKVGAQPNINSQQYQGLQLPLPSIPEQQKIAAILTAVDDKLDVIARQIEATQTLKRGLMQTLFSRGVGTQDGEDHWVPHDGFTMRKVGKYPECWQVMPFGDIAPIVRRPVNIEEDASYPELGLRSYGKGTFHKPALTGKEVGGKRLFKIEPGDLLFSNVFAWEGAVAIAQPQDAGRFGSHRYIACVVDKKKADTAYLFRYLTTPDGIEQLKLASPGGAGRNKTLGLSALGAIPIPLPPLHEQLKITEILDGVDAKLDVLASKQTHCQTLKRGLMQKLLTGEWRVKIDEVTG